MSLDGFPECRSKVDYCPWIILYTLVVLLLARAHAFF